MSWTGSMGIQTHMSEALTTDVPAATSPSISHTAWSTSVNLSSSSTPAVTKGAWFTQALTAGAATIDLTNLTGTNGIAVDLTGLKVQRLLIINGTISGKAVAAGSNSAVTITGGASNGYLLFGASGSVVKGAGTNLYMEDNETLPDIDATHCEIDLAGTGTDEFLVGILAG